MRWLLGAILLGAPALAAAQVADEEDVLVEEEQDPAEATPAEDPAFVSGTNELVGGESQLEEDQAYYWAVEMSSSIRGMDNRDFRPIDDTTRQTSFDTDDRVDFGYTDMLATLAYRPVDPAVFNMRLKYDLIWAGGQPGQAGGTGGRLSVYDLNIDAALLDEQAIGISLKFGRQPFLIGGVPRDYMLAGTVDAITARIDLRGAGRLRILGLELFSANDLPEIGYLSVMEGYTPNEGFNGDNYTLRTGLIYEIDRESQPDWNLEAKAYWFYASIGGGTIEDSGADITRGGLNGNYSDADYQHMMGVRAAYVRDFEAGGQVRLYGEFSRSMGIDRRAEEARDVDTSGNAYGGGIDIEWVATEGITLIGGAEFYHFDGSTYASDGLEFERGFVGFRGARFGGQTVGRLSNWRPSTHLDTGALQHRPHDIERVAGTRFAFGRLGVDVYGTRLTADLWVLQDTNSTFLDIDGIDDMPEPPFGYTRQEYKAQERLGRDLGQAIDLRLTQPVAQIVDLFVGYSVFMPGAYYQIEVDRLAGRDDTSLGGQETFWVAEFGTQVAF